MGLRRHVRLSPEQIRSAVQAFLQLVEEGAGDVAENEARLPALLERLALSMHDVTFEFDEADHAEPPVPDATELRALVCRRFPNYGHYNLPEVVTDRIAAAPSVVADAIDDLVDITRELREVEWRWTHTSEADALWHLDHSYRTHWGDHLRALQLYLHCLQSR